MKHTSGMDKYVDDRLIARWREPCTRSYYSQRKRLPDSATPFAKRIQEAYLQSSVAAVKFVIKETGRGLIEAFATLRYCREYGERRDCIKGNLTLAILKKEIGY